MIDRESFSKAVRDALTHLYDGRLLSDHPLGELLGPTDRRLDAEALQQVVLDAIRELRPRRAEPHDANEWRRYRHLLLRYVDGLQPVEIAEQLGISTRQARRDHQEAIEALVAILWVRYRQAQFAGRTDTGVSSDLVDPDLDAELSRIEAAPSEDGVPLEPALATAVSTVKNLAQSREVMVDLRLPSSLPPVAVNRAVLRYILVSLLSTSIEWEVRTHVTVAAREVDREVEVSFVAKLPAARGSTCREHDRLSTQQQESLYVAERLVTAQGGKLEVHAPTHGELRLHLILKPFVPSIVLVVDDNPDFVRLFRRYVTGAPYRILEAKVPAEAIRLAIDNRPDVITLDVMMPTQDGWDLLQQLKRLDETRHIPVVVCSVLRERALALSLGASEVLVKPVSRPTLLAALARHCGRPVQNDLEVFHHLAN